MHETGNTHIEWFKGITHHFRLFAFSRWFDLVGCLLYITCLDKAIYLDTRSAADHMRRVYHGYMLGSGIADSDAFDDVP